MKTILIIEDERPLGEAIKMKLEKRGYNVIHVTLAEDGMELLKKQPVDLIWLDLRLPGMDGLKFLELIRKDEKMKDNKVVIVSVSGTFDTKERAAELGAIDYIMKSEYKLDEIIARVAEKI